MQGPNHLVGMSRQLDDLAAALLIFSLALLLGEMQLRQEASLRYVCLGLIWVIAVAVDIWFVYG